MIEIIKDRNGKQLGHIAGDDEFGYVTFLNGGVFAGKCYPKEAVKENGKESDQSCYSDTSG